MAEPTTFIVIDSLHSYYNNVLWHAERSAAPYMITDFYMSTSANKKSAF
jgi:hypothetical protein